MCRGPLWSLWKKVRAIYVIYELVMKGIGGKGVVLRGLKLNLSYYGLWDQIKYVEERTRAKFVNYLLNDS